MKLEDPADTDYRKVAAKSHNQRTRSELYRTIEFDGAGMHDKALARAELARRAEADTEARKWTEIVVRNAVLMNAGAAVAVLSFLAQKQLTSYGLAAASLLLFVLGALLPQLTGLGNMSGALRLLGLEPERAWIRSPTRWLANNALSFTLLALLLFVAGAAVGLLSLVHG
jgi:VIT1/CCC1 family predicted Fe2+/Mn2+ transporter